MLSRAIAWIVAHWPAIVSVLGVVAPYLYLNVWLRKVPVEKLSASPWLRLADRLAYATANGAANRYSLPVFGKSLARAAAKGVLDLVGDDDPTPPALPPRGSPGSAGLSTLAFVVLSTALVLGLARCAATPRQVTHVAVLSTGAVVAQLEAANRRVYHDATDALRVSLAADGGRLADYDRAVAPLTAAYTARVDALVDLDAALYAAAAINDAAARGSRADAAGAARRVLEALRRGLASLSSGGLLPAVPIPPEVTGTLRGLEALATAVESSERASAPAEGGVR